MSKIWLNKWDQVEWAAWVECLAALEECPEVSEEWEEVLELQHQLLPLPFLMKKQESNTQLNCNK